MSWILNELRNLRNYAKKPLDEPQDFMDWLVFSNRAHKPQPQKIIPEVIEKDEVSRAIKNIKDEELSKPLKPFIPPAPPLPPSPEQLSPVPFKPFIPPAPPLPPSNELTPRPPKNSVVFVEEEPKENPVNDLLRSIRKGTTLKPTKKKEPVVKTSFLDELKEKPKLNKPKIVKQKEPKKEVLTFNDLIKQNKKFQALSTRNLETKDNNYVDDFEGWGRKKNKRVKKN